MAAAFARECTRAAAHVVAACGSTCIRRYDCVAHAHARAGVFLAHVPAGILLCARMMPSRRACAIARADPSCSLLIAALSSSCPPCS
eukprot:4769864-Pleurochrysis_carterae.AAC.1